jgi:hypothetical protein
MEEKKNKARIDIKVSKASKNIKKPPKPINKENEKCELELYL